MTISSLEGNGEKSISGKQIAEKEEQDPGSDENYHFLFEQATDAIMVTDFRGNFKNVNSSFCTLFGYSLEELLHLNIKDLLDPQHLETNPLRFDLLAAGETLINERKMVHKNGTIVYVEANVRTFKHDRIMAIARNITERKKVEEELRQSEANLHTIFDTTDTVYVLVDHDLRIISYNPRAHLFAKMELGHTIKTSEYFLDYFPIEKQSLLLFRMKETLGGKTTRYEVSYPQANGSYHWYDVRMFPISKGDKTIYGLMLSASDITEEKLLEQQLLDQKVQEQKKITRAVLQAQEIQRNQIGQELHDNVNQVLSVIKLYLDMISRNVPNTPELLEKSKVYIDTAIKEIRALSSKQVTPVKTLELKELIVQLISDLNVNSRGTRFHCRISPHLSIDEDLKLNIYRIVQEQINNILKYAFATQATISIHESKGMIHVSVMDNGRGFDPQQQRNGIGISNIINRIESYNGEVIIESSPGKGCKLEIRIPK